jgi:hypothetical protein
MKYLMAFESYGDNLTSTEMLEIEEKTEDCISKMSPDERNKLISDLEKFAKDHGVSIDDLEDPALVKSLLTEVNEGFGDWVSKNWYSILDKLNKYLKLGSLITMVGSLVGYYMMDMDTMTGVKVAAAAFIISNIVSALKGLK